MATMILDPQLENQLRAQRAAWGGDRFDEVWEGVYMMSPLADNEHQQIASALASAIRNSLGWNTSFQIFAGVNVSDRDKDWEHNYRCPDIAVYSKDTPAKDCGTHWCGGPDFAVEIMSPNDRSREKLEFYARVGVQELMLVDRSTWTLEFYRLQTRRLVLDGISTAAEGQSLGSEVLQLNFRLLSGKPRPGIEVACADGGKSWTV
jgi:Uma2 family endonuclease